MDNGIAEPAQRLPLGVGGRGGGQGDVATAQHGTRDVDRRHPLSREQRGEQVAEGERCAVLTVDRGDHDAAIVRSGRNHVGIQRTVNIDRHTFLHCGAIAQDHHALEKAGDHRRLQHDGLALLRRIEAGRGDMGFNHLRAEGQHNAVALGNAQVRGCDDREGAGIDARGAGKLETRRSHADLDVGCSRALRGSGVDAGTGLDRHRFGRKRDIAAYGGEHTYNLDGVGTRAAQHLHGQPIRASADGHDRDRVVAAAAIHRDATHAFARRSVGMRVAVPVQPDDRSAIGSNARLRDLERVAGKVAAKELERAGVQRGAICR